MKLIEKIFINSNCEISIKKAELKKAKLENADYRLVYSSNVLLTYIPSNITVNELTNLNN